MAKQNVPFSPAFPYNGNQIIIDSGRVMLNAKDDAILILGNKTIGLSSPGSINIDTDTSVIVNSPKIKLGIGTNSDHPLVKGDVLVNLLNDWIEIFDIGIIEPLKKSLDILGFEQTELQMVSNAFEKLTNIVQERKKELLSQTTYTK